MSSVARGERSAVTETAFNAALNVQVQFGNLKPNQVKYTDAVVPSFGLKEAKR